MIKKFKEVFQPHVEVGIIAAKEGKVLLSKTKNGQNDAYWSYPAGHLKEKESIEECAFRSLTKKTGLKGLSLHFGPWTRDKHAITLFVIVDLFDGNALIETEQEKWLWCDWNDLPSPVAPSMRSLIQTLGLEKLKQVSCCSLLQGSLSSHMGDDFHSDAVVKQSPFRCQSPTVRRKLLKPLA